MRTPAPFTLLLGLSPLLALAAVACSAEATMGADASTQGIADARRGTGSPDARGIRPDAQQQQGQPDAAPAVTCDGADTEPNNSQLQATGLSAITDCDDEGGTLTGSVISGDEDWFTFDTSDTSFCSVGPNFVLTGNVQLCTAFVCLNGNVELTCPNGTTDIGGGLTGCCGTSAFEITDYNCAGTGNEATRVHTQITATSDNTCEDYTIAYNF